MIEEIVVVAQKRAENLQDVPLSITAFDRDALENRRIDRIDDVAQRVPNLEFSTFSSGRPEFTIRGIGTSGIARSALENSVIVFLDEVYVSRSSASLFELFDLEQVSVLRGPQGTLFGKNVVGGVVSLTTSRPNADHWEARLQAGAGNFHAREFKALVSGPLSERIAAKLSLLKKDRDGFGEDLISGRDSDDQDVLALRGQALLDVAKGVELLLGADFHDSEDGSQTRSLVPEFDSFPPSAATGRVRRTEHGHEVGTGTEQWGLSAKLDWRRESGSVTGIAAYCEVDFHTLDQFGPRGIRSGQGYDDLFGQEESARQFSLELRYASERAGPWNGVAGVYYTREKVDRVEFEEITVVEESGASTAAAATGGGGPRPRAGPPSRT
ncbi:MAG: TonB-dependent receptor plug domain-containing protein [Proteobacteria bacterium]|nr:TonB-dependent receptor plug domain-containing protein [Pseudomonadota bacterium]